jgi:hypothetical protein
MVLLVPLSAVASLLTSLFQSHPQFNRLVFPQQVIYPMVEAPRRHLFYSESGGQVGTKPTQYRLL